MGQSGPLMARQEDFFWDRSRITGIVLGCLLIVGTVCGAQAYTLDLRESTVHRILGVESGGEYYDVIFGVPAQLTIGQGGVNVEVVGDGYPEPAVGGVSFGFVVDILNKPFSDCVHGDCSENGGSAYDIAGGGNWLDYQAGSYMGAYYNNGMFWSEDQALPGPCWECYDPDSDWYQGPLSFSLALVTKAQPIPEPATGPLMLAGFLGVAAIRRRVSRQAASVALVA